MIDVRTGIVLLATVCVTGVQAGQDEISDFVEVCPAVVTGSTNLADARAARGLTQTFTDHWSKDATATAFTTEAKDTARIVISAGVAFGDADYSSCVVTVDSAFREEDFDLIRKQLESSLGPMLGESFFFDGNQYHVYLKTGGSDPLITLKAIGSPSEGAVFTLERWALRK